MTVACVSAEPIVIKDYGRSKPIGWELKNQRTFAVSPSDPVQEVLIAQWPLNTYLTFGKFSPRPLPKSMGGLIETPIFLIGSDRQSQAWLLKKKPELIAIGAKGILIESPNNKRFLQIKSMAKPLIMNAMSIDDIAVQLNLNHYPVLISTKGITQ